MKLTADPINIDGDYNRNGIPTDHPLKASAVFFTKVAEINAYLCAVRNALSSGLGIDESSFIKIPVAFKVEGGGAFSTELPNMINMIAVQNEQRVMRLVVPEPFFEPFFEDLHIKLASIAIKPACCFLLTPENHVTEVERPTVPAI